MSRSFGLLLLLTFAATVHPAFAQSPVPLPSIVTQNIGDDTMLVSRIDLNQPGLATIARLLRGIPDPFGSFASPFNKFDQALQKLAALKTSEVFLLISTNHLLTNDALIMIPAKGTKPEREAIAEVFQSLGFQNRVVTSDGVVVGTVPFEFKSAERPEFAMALSSVKASQVQIAVGLGKDARRVLREVMRTLPLEFGGGSITPISDGCQWMALGFTLPPKPDFVFVMQSNDSASAEALDRIVEASLKAFLEKAVLDKSLRNLRSVVEQITLRNHDNRLTISLDFMAGGPARKQIEEELIESISQVTQNLGNNARQTQTRDNLKRLMLAMHNYNDAYKAFPPVGVRSADGKKLLSWRVLLLPYLGEGALFKEFRLDEPWDSEHNRKLISRMPDVFETTNISLQQREEGMTTFLGLVADKTLFSATEGTTIKQISDGTSNTIAIVNASSEHAVVWTRPADLDVDLTQPLKGLTGQYGGRFWVALADGSVNTITEKIAPETLRRLFQINDGEVVGEY